MTINKNEIFNIVLDLNDLNWYNYYKNNLNKNNNYKNLFEFLEIIYFMISFYLSQNNNNIFTLTIIKEDYCELIFPKINNDELLLIQNYNIKKIINIMKNRIINIINNSPELRQIDYSCLHKGLAISLIINNKINKLTNKNNKKNRILIIFISNIQHEKYTKILNCCNNSIIDILMLNPNIPNSTFLLQIAKKTNGLIIPLQFEIPKSIIIYFTNAFLVNIELRKNIKLPYLTKDTLSSLCKCHNKKINLGRICSCCLSLYCNEFENNMNNCLYCSANWNLTN